ncbi:hypothetical protein DW975_05390 [Agathobacter rectalis]|uniref:Uncharacterized protein n=1 Tax=Agathobacter rectalis TaxID=39491 RepID=A0A413PI04_9FIRM|nr:hypothetical protein DXA03_03740 [Agathobacter rectalis]RGZ75669.1 hypothetical protein DW975_05390 [Agathobacter rectalis]
MLVLLLLLSEGQHEHTIYDMKDLTPLVQKRIPLYKWMVELNFAIFIGIIIKSDICINMLFIV